MKKNKTITQQDITKDDEIIINTDDFCAIDELCNDNILTLKEKNTKKIFQNIKEQAKNLKNLKKLNPIATLSLSNQTNYHSKKDSKATIHFTSKNKNNIKKIIKQNKIKSRIKKIIFYDAFNNSNNYCSTSKKSIFSKISESLYTAYDIILVQ